MYECVEVCAYVSTGARTWMKSSVIVFCESSSSTAILRRYCLSDLARSWTSIATKIAATVFFSGAFEEFLWRCSICPYTTAFLSSRLDWRLNLSVLTHELWCGMLVRDVREVTRVSLKAAHRKVSATSHFGIIVLNKSRSINK